MKAMFGRERELQTVEALLDDARQRCSVLVVEGEPGIGKTAMWNAATRMGRDAGFSVLSSRPAQAEVRLAFASLSDLLGPVGEEVLSQLPEPQRRPLEVALLRTSRVRGRSEPRAVATGLLSVLTHLSERSPVLITIDDTQWLDRASAAALAFAVRRLDPESPLGLLVAVRTERGHAADVLDLRQHPPHRLTVVRLGPLTKSALHRVITAEVGVTLVRPVLHQVEQASMGNPFFAVELARALRSRGDRSPPGSPLPVPESLADLLTARLDTLPPSAQRVLLAAALIPHPTCELIERCLGGTATAGLERARRAGLIEFHGESVRFVHPLYASAVFSGALPAQRRSLHRRLAGLVEDPEERARHLSLGATGPDEDVAQALEHAAALARARGAWGTAAELLEQASELTPPQRGDDAGRRVIAAAEHNLYAGDRPRGRVLIEAVLSEPLSGPLRPMALHLLGRISHSDENAHEARRLLMEALRSADDPALAGAIELDLVYVHSTLMEFRDGSVHAYRALENAEEAGDRALTALSLAHCAMMDFLCARGVDWEKVERSLALYDEADGLVPLVQRPATLAACLLLYVGRHDEARARLTALCATASSTGDESDLAFLLLWRSWLETRAGDLPAAAALAEESAAIGMVTGSLSMHAWALTQQALVHAHLGAVAETRRLCAEALGPVRRSGSLLPNLWLAASLGLLELSLGHAEAAWQACAPLTEALEQQGLGEPVMPFFLPDALEALITLGHLDRADALVAALEARGRDLDRVWALAAGARCRGLLLAARGDLDAALSAFERALAEHQRIDLPFDRARTLLARGVVERRSRQRRRALSSLEEARVGFEQVGARLWADRATAEIDRIPIRRAAATHVLTPTQQRVAELVAGGQTNREVAQRLFVSEKTVEANLTRIYRKLGVRSRAELAVRIMAGVREQETTTRDVGIPPMRDGVTGA